MSMESGEISARRFIEYLSKFLLRLKRRIESLSKDITLNPLPLINLESDMQISSFEVYELVKEMRVCRGYYIEKVYQIGEKDILLKIRRAGTGKNFIFIRAGGFAFCSREGFDTPEKPSTFAMTLRKYIERGRIEEINQHGFDRIIIMEIDSSRGKFYLVCEFIPNGNIVLLDEDFRIILPLREQTWSHRILKSREKYIFPPSQRNVLNMDVDEFSNILKSSDKDVVRTLAIDLGFGGIYAEEICLQSGVGKNKSSKELEREETEHLYNTFRKIIDRIEKGDISPEIVLDGDKVVAITLFPIKKFDNFTKKPMKSLLDALEYFVRNLDNKEIESKKPTENLEKQIKLQMEGMLNLIKKSEEKREEGDLIYMHLYQIEQIIERIRSILEKKEKEMLLQEIRKIDIVEDVDLSEGIVRLKLKNGKERIVDIDFRKSAAENANLAYNLSRKYREKAERAKKAKEESKMKLQNKEKAESEKKVERKKEFWFEKYRWCISSKGNLIIGGRDAKTNERIVKKHMEDDDIYVHADIHGAPSCILKARDTDGKRLKITEDSIKEGCQFAAVYSKAWKQFGEVMVYWVYPYQVSKTPQSGEFLPRGAFVIRGKRNYVRCKMEMAVGVTTIKGVDKVMGGAVESIKARCRKYIILQPGSIKKEKISRILAEKFGVTQDEVMRALPPGDVQVIDVHGFEIGDME